MYIISRILVNRHGKVMLSVMQVGAALKTKSTIMEDKVAVKLANSGEIVVGVNNKKSEFKLESRKIPEFAIKGLSKMDQRISNQIPLMIEGHTNEDCNTAVALRRVSKTLYDAVIADTQGNTTNISIDTEKRGYTKYAWNLRHAEHGEKSLEIMGYSTAILRSGQIIHDRIQKGIQEDGKIKHPNQDVRFWVAGINVNINKPNDYFRNKEYTKEACEEFDMLNLPDDYLKVVDLHQKVGERFKVLNMSPQEVLHLNLYAKVGNIEMISLNNYCHMDFEKMCILNFGVLGYFKEKIELMYKVKRGFWCGFSFEGMYYNMVGVHEKEIKSMCICTKIDSIGYGRYKLEVITCNGEVININSGGNPLWEVGVLSNISNIKRGSSDKNIVQDIAYSTKTAGEKANKLGKFKDSCGVCIGKPEYDQSQDGTKINTEAYFYDKIYRVKIHGWHYGMLKEDIESQVKFEIVGYGNRRLWNNPLIESAGSRCMDHIYIALDHINDSEDKESTGFILNKI